MPNLGGIFSFKDNRSNLRERLQKMENILTYYDWYQKYCRVENNMGAVNVSTGIFQLSNQPIFNEKRDLWLMMEGEIYDFRDLRKDLIAKGHEITGNGYDECILHLYEEFGDEFVERINGQFVIIIYSVPDQRLLILNDRLGFRPLYYCSTNQEFIFSSEIKGILAAEAISREVDEAGLMNFMSFGYNLSDRTLLKNINVLPAASVMKLDRSGYKFKTYWSMRFGPENGSKSPDYYAEELGGILKKAVKRRCSGRYGISLSGGLDSRMVAGALQGENEMLYTYTYGAPGNMDVQISKKIAQAIGAKNERFIFSGESFFEMADQIIWHSEGNLSILHCKSVCFQRQLKEKIDILLTGHLGDHLLGFPINRKLLNTSNRQIVNALFDTHFDFRDIRSKGSIFSDDFRDFINRKLKVELQYSIPALHIGDDPLFENILQAWDINNRQRRFILAAIAIDRHIFEIRTPFSDYDLIDFILRIPTELRYNYYIYKKMAIKTFPLFNEIPWTKTELKLTSGKYQEKFLVVLKKTV